MTSGFILSLLMLGALALGLGAVLAWRRNERRQATLMGLAALVMLGNVLIWTIPLGDSSAPVSQQPR